MAVHFKPNADNAANPTLNVNGLGAKAIVKNGSTPLAAADIKNGQVISLVYDGTNFQLVAASAGGGSSVAALDDLTDVTISSPATGQVLRKSAGNWVNSAIQAGDLPGGIDAAKIGSGTVSNAEFGYLDGVTSAVQTQLNGKAATSHTHAAADITSGLIGLARGGTNANLSATGGAGQVLKQSSAGGAVSVGALAAGDMPSGIDAAKIGSGTVSNTEFGYLDGVTSAVQTQLDGKAAASHTHAASDISSGTLGVSRGGTGLSTLGTALQLLRVNSGGSALEYYTPTANCCVVRRTTSKTWVANYVEDAISWDSEVIDTSDMHSTSVNNDRIILNQAGKWLVYCSLGFANNSGGGHQPWMSTSLFKNTTQVAYASTRIGSWGYSDMHSHITQVVTSNGSDYVQLKIATDDWTKAVLNPSQTSMMAIYLGA
ncbi:MAG: hypothetical protein KIS61_29280 [Candidatus Eremiobacteraeota bacterium]|nr:hypothetical protein [Candidatus Eremiobacteraeota bacterium]